MTETSRWARGLAGLVGLAALAVLLIVLLGRAADPAPVGQAVSTVETTATTATTAPQFESVLQSPVETPAPPPTRTPWPTVTPSMTPTEPPFPTRIPTPVVTPIPTAAPPLVDLPAEPIAGEYTILYREGHTIRSIQSDGRDARVLIDVTARTPLFLADERVSVDRGREWSLSPDGSRLALVLSNVEQWDSLPQGTAVEYSLYLFDLRSGELRLLVEDGIEPVWSPDGSQVAYQSAVTRGLWIVDVDTGQARKVYGVDRENGHYVIDIDWSPDGAYLVFLDSVFRQSNAMMIIDVQQTHLADELLPWTLYWLYAPQWSPSGDAILYTSSEGSSSSSENFDNLWLIQADGTNPRQLTQDLTVIQARWSPDGQWIAFGAPPAYEEPEPLYELWLLDRSGQVLKRLTSNAVQRSNDDAYPVWSPDGAYLFFVREPGEQEAVWMFSLLDGVQTMIPQATSNFIVLKGYPLRAEQNTACARNVGGALDIAGGHGRCPRGTS